MRSLALLLSLVLCASIAHAQEPLQSDIVLDGVEVAGESHFSSGEVPREPRIRVTNTTDEARTVILTGMYGLDGASRVLLALRVPATITLAPGESRQLILDFEGTAPQLGGGLPYSRFAVLARVDAARGEVIASVGYMCRIPRAPGR